MAALWSSCHINKGIVVFTIYTFLFIVYGNSNHATRRGVGMYNNKALEMRIGNYSNRRKESTHQNYRYSCSLFTWLRSDMFNCFEGYVSNTIYSIYILRGRFYDCIVCTCPRSQVGRRWVRCKCSKSGDQIIPIFPWRRWL